MEKKREGGRKVGDRSVRVCVDFVVAALGTAVSVPPGLAAAENHEVTVERNIAAKMRDGVTLRADIYRPKEDGKYPVLLVRTPYDKQAISGFGHRGAARGYVVIAQDVWGRFELEGELYTFKHVSEDGYGTLESASSL